MGMLPENLPEVDSLTLQEIYNHPVVQELADKRIKDLEASVKLPFRIKDKVLMSPGTWNNFYYGAQIIDLAFKNTEWGPTSRSLFWDHMDDQASEWVGEVDSLKCENGNLVGDVIVVDKDLAIKLAYGAKFGISPKIIGESDYYRRVQDAHFENFSIVINPAVKTTFLNSQIKIKTEEKNMPTDESSASAQAAKLQEEEIEEEETETTEEMKEKKKEEELKKKKYEYPEKEKKYEYPEEMKTKLAEIESKLAEVSGFIAEMKKKGYEYPAEAKEKYPKEAACSDKELSEHLSDYTDFIKDFLKKNPGKNIKDAASAWAKEHSEMDERHRLTDYKEDIVIPGAETVVSSKPGEFTSEMREMISPKGPDTVPYEALPTDADVKMAQWVTGGLN